MQQQQSEKWKWILSIIKYSKNECLNVGIISKLRKKIYFSKSYKWQQVQNTPFQTEFSIST